jgi:hypothetical protein
MGFNRRKMEDQRRQAAEKEVATRRATDVQVLEDAECLVAVVITGKDCGNCVLVAMGQLVEIHGSSRPALRAAARPRTF